MLNTGTERNNTIPAINPDNKYGYIFNINNHTIRKLKTLYCQKYNIPEHWGLNDEQRRQFEAVLCDWFGDKYRRIYGGEYVFPGEPGSPEMSRMNNLIDAIPV